MTPEASASTTTSNAKISSRRSGRLDAGTDAGSSLGIMESRSSVSQIHDFPPEALEAKRAALLEEKQAVLEQVVDRHDSFVRELFHMQQFTMMILYDPVEAKQDNSEVFQEFKSNFDLFANAVPTSQSSRRTRQRLNERRQLLRTPPSIRPSPPKKKRKSNAMNTEEVWSVIGSNQKKHGQANEEHLLENAAGQNKAVDGVESAESRLPTTEGTVFVRRKGANMRIVQNHEEPTTSLSVPGEAVVTATKKRRRDDSPVATVQLPPDKASDEIVVRPNGMKENMHGPVISPGPISTRAGKRVRKLRDVPVLKKRDPTKPKICLIPPHPDTDHESPTPRILPETPSISNIKRIRLIVRRPPPQFSNPKQKPTPSKFNSSLHDFLSSYVAVHGGQNAKPKALDQEAIKEANLRAKVAKLRRDGRFVPQREVKDDDSDIVDDADYVSPERTSKDQWDAVVENAIARYQARPKRSIAKQVTSTIASKMQAYFDNLEAKKLKAKEADEKKLRILAKSTMRMVIAEWKKAVFHIRDKQRLVEEEEERRLGRAHLDAILSQSGQILETQQEDLSKRDVHRSRSQSLSVGESDVDSDTDLEGEGVDAGRGGEPGNIEGAGFESGEELGELDDGGSFMLIDNTTETLTRSGTPSSTISGMPYAGDDAEEGLTTDLLSWYHTIEEDVDANLDASSVDLDYLRHPNFESSPVRQPPNNVPKPGESCTEDRHVALDSASDDIPLREADSVSPPLLPVEIPPEDLPWHSELEADELEAGDGTGFEQQISAEAGNDEIGALDVPSGQDTGDSGTPKVDDLISEEGYQKQGELTDEGQEEQEDVQILEHLKPYAVAPVKWDPDKKITPPLLLRGVLRPYQQSGLEWLASLHTNKLNGILADEMGLGKTIQTIALLAHLACDIGIWGPHLIIVPTSVLLNWDMEFKKFLPGFRILSYHGSTKRRKELRQGWNDKHHFNVCITSYALASRDAHIFKRKAWYYMILDEAHMIKNFKSQRWNILLMFRSYRRLLLTGTPLQNNLTELWALLQFLMSGANFANLKEFGEWFSNPLEKAIEMGNIHDDETLQRVSKLHTVLRPYLLRRLKRDVEKELPSKFEHLTLCPLSKRQRFLYDEFMSRAQTKDALDSGVYQKIANILMQLRKVCNHPDLFEVRPIVTPFALTRSAIADYEIKELLIRRQVLYDDDQTLGLDVRFIDRQDVSLLQAVETRRLDASIHLPHFGENVPELPVRDTRVIEGFRKFSTSLKRAESIARWTHIGYLNRLRCSRMPIYSEECLSIVNRMTTRLIPSSNLESRFNYMDNVNRVNLAITSFSARAQAIAETINIFAFAIPPVAALDLPYIALAGYTEVIREQALDFDQPLHAAAVKLQIAFPEPALVQYDCGKLQKLATLLREKKTGGHRVLIFTQMTRILDILEIFLNFHGYLYLRLDGATKIEDRQYITERFNADPRVFCFISSSRSGGVGINLTGADTVIFYDSDFNPQMDKQCEDRAHRIGQIRDVHIYRFVSQYTVEEAMLRKANQKRSLDDLVIQKGEFDWRTLFSDESTSALTKALGDYEDAEDRLAAIVAAREETTLVGADDDDFDEDGGATGGPAERGVEPGTVPDDNEVEEGGTVVDYMVVYVEQDWDHFSDWRV